MQSNIRGVEEDALIEAVCETTTEREFFCGPKGQIAFRNGFIYGPDGDVVGSYSERRRS